LIETGKTIVTAVNGDVENGNLSFLNTKLC
jgi:hypothetical protein